MFKVQKKDGTLEDFDRNHIITGIMKAGGTTEEAEKVAAALEEWAPSAAVSGVIQSSAIRVKGLEVLQTVNPVVAATFEAYKKQN